MSAQIKHNDKDGSPNLEKNVVASSDKDGANLSTDFIDSMVHLGYFDDGVLKKKDSDNSSISSAASSSSKNKMRNIFGLNFKQNKSADSVDSFLEKGGRQNGKEQRILGVDIGNLNTSKSLHPVKEEAYHQPSAPKVSASSFETKANKLRLEAMNELRKSSLAPDDKSLEKKLAIDSNAMYFMRFFRENDTFVTISCKFDDQARDLNILLAKKLKIPEDSNYCIYMSKLGKGERMLYPFERPVKILVKLLSSIGYKTDELKHVVREDNSYICCFSFKEMVINNDYIHFEDIPSDDNYENVNMRGQNILRTPASLEYVADRIRSLDLSQNLLVDFPLEFALKSKNLRRLKLCRNEYQLIPSSISKVKSLKALDLSNNCITSLDTGNLHLLGNLDHLILCNNQISNIPIDYEAFVQLTVLDLSNNNLTSFPNPLCKMSQLVHLDLSYNRLVKIPPLFRELRSLKRLFIVNNGLKGILPDCFKNLQELILLDIRRNFLDNIDVLSFLSQLEDLRCDQNFIESVTFKDQKFTQLVLSKNPLYTFGEVNLNGLTALNLSFCHLKKLPDSIFEGVSKLISLKLNNNQLTEIPKFSIDDLPHLEVFQCVNNQLETLPESLFVLPRLTQVDVHSNRLKKIPLSIWQSGSLYFFNASSNLLVNFPVPSTGPTAMGGLQAANVKPGQSSLPLALKLRHLILADNRLTEDVFSPISFLTQLNVLNLSCNDIYEVPPGGFFNLVNVTELYFSGNQIANFPVEEVERLRRLKVFYLNANKLPSLPAELRKLGKLVVLDVANNQLNYNLSNWTYDWNWNCNRELKYLNLSGNKRLKIMNSGIMNSLSKDNILTDFDELTHLRVLGLIDLDVMNTKLEQTTKRRARSYESIINDMGFGLSDRLDRSENLLSWDFVVPSFRESNEESLFGIFDITSNHQGNRQFGKYLSDWMAFHLTAELRKFEKSESDTESTLRALRTTFLILQREAVGHFGFEQAEAASIALVYRKGLNLYLAHIGDTLTVVVRNGTPLFISSSHSPAFSDFDSHSITETNRIRQDGGYVTRAGRINSEVHLSRCFGLFHQLPAINANPSLDTVELTSDDEIVIIASRGLWDVMSYQTAVDIARTEPHNAMLAAQKLRDFAIAYGAEGSIMVMVLGISDLLDRKLQSERRRRKDKPDFHFQGSDDKKLPHSNWKKARNQDASSEVVSVEPPVGKIVIVFTGIKNTTFLWENYPEEMALASRLHDNVLRSTLKEVKGYEVKNEGDTFMASFHSVTSAILWCSLVQLRLLQVEWPQAILSLPDCREVYDSQDAEQVLYRGLSIRMGMNFGEPLCEKDPMTGRMDYFGPMVNKSARVSGEAKYGEICISSDILAELMNIEGVFDFEPEAEPVTTCSESEAKANHEIQELRKLGLRLVDIGERKLKGVELPEPLVLLFPKSIASRANPERHQVASKDKLRVSVAPIPSDKDQSRIKLARSLGLTCLRIEDTIHSLVRQTPGPSLELLEEQMLSKINESMPARELSKVIEVLSCRIENASATLSLIQMGSSQAEVLDTIRNYLTPSTQ